jgi:thiol-disulfide isomerase/thioredoxin
MRSVILILLTLAAGLLAGRADETFAVLRAGSVTYSNVTVTTVNATDVFFTYAGGMGNVKLKNLSPDLQQHFRYDPAKAAKVEAQQAANKLKYHDELLHQPVVHPPDMTRDPTAPSGQQPAWQQGLAKVLQQAQTQNRFVLLDFTGSDWCPWCIKFDQEVLSTSKFAAYSGQKLIFVKVDFLRHSPQPDDLKQANDALATQFKVDGFPTYVLLSGSGRELGRQAGYRPGGPDAFIAELEAFSRQ